MAALHHRNRRMGSLFKPLLICAFLLSCWGLLHFFALDLRFSVDTGFPADVALIVSYIDSSASGTREDGKGKVLSSVGVAVRPRRTAVATETATSNNGDTKTRPAPKRSPAPTPPPGKQRKITLIVKLMGELGNQLSKIACARITQLLAAKRGIAVELVGQRQTNYKWKLGANDITKCFPKLRNFIFEGGRYHEEFQIKRQIQQQWLGEGEQVDKLENARAEGLDFLESLLRKQRDNAGGWDSENNATIPAPEPESANYSIPYLTSTCFDFESYLEDEELYNDVRDFLEFDYEACCGSLAPQPYEIVFHYRNFYSELRDHPRAREFLELSPNNTVQLLFNHTRRNRKKKKGKRAKKAKTAKVAVSSRFTMNLGPYTTAVQGPGDIQTRLIEGQTGVQDFCFLLQAKRELIGNRVSSFARVASLLSNATKVQLYTAVKTNMTETQEYKRRVFQTASNRTFVLADYFQREDYHLDKVYNRFGRMKRAVQQQAAAAPPRAAPTNAPTLHTAAAPTVDQPASAPTTTTHLHAPDRAPTIARLFFKKTKADRKRLRAEWPNATAALPPPKAQRVQQRTDKAQKREALTAAITTLRS